MGQKESARRGRKNYRGWKMRKWKIIDSRLEKG